MEKLFFIMKDVKIRIAIFMVVLNFFFIFMMKKEIVSFQSQKKDFTLSSVKYVE